MTLSKCCFNTKVLNSNNYPRIISFQKFCRLFHQGKKKKPPQYLNYVCSS